MQATAPIPIIVKNLFNLSNQLDSSNGNTSVPA